MAITLHGASAGWILLIRLEGIAWMRIASRLFTNGLDSWKHRHGETSSFKQKNKITRSRLIVCAKKLGIERDMHSLRLSGQERVWGILDQGVLSVLWWDPDHAVCPSLRE